MGESALVNFPQNEDSALAAPATGESVRLTHEDIISGIADTAPGIADRILSIPEDVRETGPITVKAVKDPDFVQIHLQAQDGTSGFKPGEYVRLQLHQENAGQTEFDTSAPYRVNVFWSEGDRQPGERSMPGGLSFEAFKYGPGDVRGWDLTDLYSPGITNEEFAGKLGGAFQAFDDALTEKGAPVMPAVSQGAQAELPPVS